MRMMLPRVNNTMIGVGTVLLLIHLGFSSTSALAADLTSPSNLVSNGLKNLGNTCYMNSQLQCAFHIPAVRNLVLAEPEIQADEDEDPAMEGEPPTEDNDDEEEGESTAQDGSDSADDESQEPVAPEESAEDVLPTKAEPPKPEPDSEALIALRELFNSMILASENSHVMQPVLPRQFCLRLGIPVMVQQDSQEFWKLLLPAINREKLSDLYKGSFEDYITALDGSGREKRREELFLDLSVDIPPGKSTLLESIKASFGGPELLSVEEGNGWRPEKGADKVNAHKGSSLIAKGLPPILQFHLKRFNYDWNTDTTSKVNNRLAFPVELDLSEVVTCEDEDSTSDVLYDLQSVVIHMGEYGIGHYYSYVRPDIRKDDWYRFNDDIVEKVTIQEVLDDAYGGRVLNSDKLVGDGSKGGNGRPGGLFGWVRRIVRNIPGDSFGYGGRTSNAYVIQYARRADQSMLYPTE